MIVTGMLLADVLRISEGKVDVLGGVIDTWTSDRVGTGEPQVFPLLVLTQSGGPDDSPKAHLQIEVRAPSGDLVGQYDVTYVLPAGAENGFLVAHIPTRLPEEGRYTFRATARGSGDYGVAIGVRVIAANRDQSP